MSSRTKHDHTLRMRSCKESARTRIVARSGIGDKAAHQSGITYPSENVPLVGHQASGALLVDESGLWCLRDTCRYALFGEKHRTVHRMILGRNVVGAAFYNKEFSNTKKNGG